MWLLLTSETLLFAGLFGLYAAYRVRFPQGFERAIAHSEVLIGTTNTALLLTSSLLVASAVHALRERLQLTDLSGDGVDTVTGYITQELGRLPRVGDLVEISRFNARVLSVQNKRAKQVLLSPKPPEVSTSEIASEAAK